MAMLNFDITTYGRRNADCNGNGFRADVVLSEIFDWSSAKSLEESGKAERYKSRLQKIIYKAKKEYLNIKQLNLPSHAMCVHSASNKSVASYVHLLGNKIMSQENHSNDIDVDSLVFSYVLEATLSTLTVHGKLFFISRLQRISVGGVEGYLGIKGASPHSTRKNGASRPSSRKKEANSPLTKIKEASSPLTKTKEANSSLTREKEACTTLPNGLHNDKAQGCDCTKALTQKPPTHAPATNKISKYSYEGICEDLYARSKLPEGLLLAQSIYCAKTALAYYNDKHGTEYKLVEPLSSARLYDYDGVHFHCNFTAAAKLKKDGSCTAQPKLFFANFIRLRRGLLRDMYCRIIDPAKAIFWCCEVCPPDLAHCHRRAGKYNVLRRNSPEYFEATRKRLYAEIALDVYNKKHGTEYKLVKPLECNVVPVSFGTYRFHCNFKARLNKIPNSSESSNDDAPKKLFFGDVFKSFRFSDGEFCILESTEGLDDHCSICQKGAAFHPGHHGTPSNT